MANDLQFKWPKVKIDDLKAQSAAAIAIGPFGSRMKADCYEPTGVPVVRGLNISDTKRLSGEFVFISERKADEFKSCILQDGDLFFPHRGLIGQVGIMTSSAGRRFVMSSSLMKLTCNTGIVDPLFLFYFFRSPFGRNEILKHSSQVGTPGIGTPLTSLKSIEAPMPPLRIQKAISSLLGELDDLMDANSRVTDLLLRMARTLFQHWFVEGGDEADTQPLTALVEVDPTIRIPKGKEVPYVDMRALPTDGISVSDVARRPAGSGSKFQNGDTLFARITPCLENGKTAFVDFLDGDEAGVGSTEFIVLRAKPGVSPQFVCCCARSPELRTHAIKSMVGTSGRQRVRSDCFEHFRVKRFSPDIMREFHEQTLPWFQQIRANVKENQILTRTRDYLLPKLLSGEVSAENVEVVA